MRTGWLYEQRELDDFLARARAGQANSKLLGRILTLEMALREVERPAPVSPAAVPSDRFRVPA
jgi:hypothetical protein